MDRRVTDLIRTARYVSARRAELATRKGDAIASERTRLVYDACAIVDELAALGID